MKLKYLFAAFVIAALMPAICSAQGPVVQYQTFIYTNQTLSQEIQKVNDMQESDATRRFGTDLLDATGGVAQKRRGGKQLVYKYKYNRRGEGFLRTPLEKRCARP